MIDNEICVAAACVSGEITTVGYSEVKVQVMTNSIHRMMQLVSEQQVSPVTLFN